MLLIADNNKCTNKNYRHHRRRHRRPRRCYNRRSRYWRSDCGRLLKSPISFVHSMGRRVLEWLELRHERFLHTRTSPEDMDRSIYELSKVSADRCYYLPPSTPPQVRLPHHLRRPPFKIYVPRRRLAAPSSSGNSPRRTASFKRAHYQSLRGRPVPVPIDVIRFLTQRGVVSMSSLPKIIQEKLRDLSKIPVYLTFSNYANTSLVSRDETVGCVDSQMGSKTGNASSDSKYFATFVPAVSEESESVNTHNDCNFVDSAVDNLSTADVTDDAEKSAFSVASSNVSPKLLEVVASLRAKSEPPQPCRDWTKPNNLDKPSAKINCRVKPIITSTDTRRSLRYQQTQFSEGNSSSYSSRGDLMRRSCHNLIERPHCSKLSIFSENDASNYNYCLPANVTDFKFDDQDNFWRNDSKRYRTKSVVALAESSSTSDENTYDAVDPIYDAISDSGYSSIALSSQESVEAQALNNEQQLLSSESSPLIMNSPVGPIENTIRRSNISNSKSALARLSQSFGRFTISNKDRERSKSFEIYVDLFGASQDQSGERQKHDDSKWRTKSAEELSIYSSVDVADSKISSTPVELVNDPIYLGPNSASPSDFSHTDNSEKFMVTHKPQRSFLHSPASLHAAKFNQQLCVKRELPPIPASAQSASGSKIKNNPGKVSALHGIITNSVIQVSTAPSCSGVTDTKRENPVEKSRELSGGSDGRSNHPQPLKQAPKRTSPPGAISKQQQPPSNGTPRFLPTNPGSGIAPPPAPVGPFRYPSAVAPSPGGVVNGVGVLPPKRVPSPHSKLPTTSVDASSAAAAQGFQPHFNGHQIGKKAPPHTPPSHSSSLIKGINSAGGQNQLNAANDGGVLRGGDVTPAPLQHVTGGVPGLQKSLPLIPSLHSPSDSNGHNARANPILPGGIGGVRRPGLENMGAAPTPMAPTPPPPGPPPIPPMSSATTRPGNEYSTREGVNECHHQESVRLSVDGPRIVLTPLYKSLVQQNFFHLVTRENAEILLKGFGGGAFLVRPSTRGHPLTLMLTHQGSFCNINIRHRTDGLFALGAEKLNEKTFKSVEELIEFYRKNLLKLNTGGEVLLTNSPAHDAMHIYVRVPIHNAFPGGMGREGS